MSKVLVPIAEGFEEIEAVTIIDILRRAGADVVVAGLGKMLVEGSHGITIRVNLDIDSVDAEEFDMIVLPGGMPGMVNLKNSRKVLEIVRTLNESGWFTAAVCASPVVLEEAGITRDHSITVHPNHAKYMVKARYTGERTEVDGQLITGQSAGSAMEFAFKLVEILFGKDKVKEVNKGVIARLD